LISWYADYKKKYKIEIARKMNTVFDGRVRTNVSEQSTKSSIEAISSESKISILQSQINSLETRLEASENRLRVLEDILLGRH
jgi:hypothetical protein